MANCRNCGQPLKKGNIRIIRKPGKRPYRVCRRCPDQARSVAVHLADLPTMCDNCPNRMECVAQAPGKRVCLKWNQPQRDPVGNALQWPQDSIEGSLMIEGAFNYPDPPKYRYFVTREAMEKLKRAIERGIGGVNLEIIPVPDYQVEANTEDFEDLIEVEVKGSWFEE